MAAVMGTPINAPGMPHTQPQKNDREQRDKGRQFQIFALQLRIDKIAEDRLNDG